MTAAETIALERERTKRMFIQSVGSYFGVDQSFAGTDGLAVNSPGAYQVYGGAGYAVEGQPASQAQVQTAIPMAVLVGLGLLAAYALFKRG